MVQLLDHLKDTQLGDDDLAAALARRVWATRPTEGRDDRRAEFRETLELLRRFTHQLRQEIARS